MNTDKLNNIAINILKKHNLYYTEKFGSTIAVLMVISIILTCIRIIQECNKTKVDHFTKQEYVTMYNSNIKNFSKNRNWFTKLRLKKILRKEMSKDDYKQYGDILAISIFDYGEILTEDDTITLMEAAHV